MASGTTRTVTVNVVGDATGLNKTMTGAASTSESAGSRISSAFKKSFGAISSASGGAFGPIQEVLEGLDGQFAGIMDKSTKVGEKLTGIGVAGAGAGAVLSAFGSKDQAALQQLQAAITSTGGSYGDYKGQIDDTVSSMAKYGYQSNETYGAIQTLTQSTGSTSKALGLMGLAANLAASRHESLTTAATSLNTILAGKGTKTLQQYGITTQQVTAAGANHTVILNLLAQKLQGQASAAADTFGGKLKAVRAEVENNVAAIGAKYGPALTAAGAGMAVLGSVTTGVSAILEKFKGAEALATTAEGAEAAATSVEDVALGVEDAGLAVADAEEGLALAPILLIVAAIVALGVGIYELVTHWSEVWGEIKAIVSDAWQGIKTDFIDPIEGFFSSIVGFIESHWKLLLEILAGPWGLAYALISKYWDDIIGLPAAALNFIEAHWKGILEILTGPIGLAVKEISGHFDSIVNFVTGFPGKIASTAAHMWDGIFDSFKGTIDSVIGVWNDMSNASKFNIPSFNTHIPGVGTIGGGSIGPLLPKLPMLASGGIAVAPTIAGIGEAGPEAIVPLDRLGAMIGGGNGGGGGGMLEATITIDGKAFAKATVPYTRSELLKKKHNGSQIGLA